MAIPQQITKPGEIVSEIRIAAPRERVFKALVGLEEALGLGNAADVWGGGVRRMRGLSLSGRAGRTRLRIERRHVRSGRRPNGG